jgi:hypothetical protein
VSADALALLGRGDLAATWRLELPSGVQAIHAEDGGVRLQRDGVAVGFIPPVLVADADDHHWTQRVGRFELEGLSNRVVLTLVVPAEWAFDAARVLPLRIDPTVSLQPDNDFDTGFVDEFGDRSTGAIDSGSLALVGFGSDVRGYAEFDTSSIPDGATITDVHLRVWLSNHDNPGDPAVPLRMEVKAVGVPASFPEDDLWDAIGPLFAGNDYVFEQLVRTGPEFCPDSYVFRDYDLGPDADADVQAALPLDFFTVGFASQIVTDPDFDHIDYIGFPEEVQNPFTCFETDFPNTRITLVVEFTSNRPPVCNAGGPYVADCPNDAITIDGSGSSDPDGDPILFAWTTDCPGTIADPSAAVAVLDLDAGCAADCMVTLAVTDVPSSPGAVGETVTCATTVNAQDLTPPDVTATDLTELCLWPPRHDYFHVGSAASHVTAVDACQPFVNVTWTGCSSDQPDEAPEDGRPENGDGHFTEDCFVDAAGELWVRVERAGRDPVAGRNTFVGRHYSVGVSVDDGCGNVVTLPGTMRVPHDRRGGSGGQDDPCQRGTMRRH